MTCMAISCIYLFVSCFSHSNRSLSHSLFNQIMYLWSYIWITEPLGKWEIRSSVCVARYKSKILMLRNMHSRTIDFPSLPVTSRRLFIYHLCLWQYHQSTHTHTICSISYDTEVISDESHSKLLISVWVRMLPCKVINTCYSNLDWNFPHTVRLVRKRQTTSIHPLRVHLR